MSRIQGLILCIVPALCLAAPAAAPAQPQEPPASRPAKLNITISRETTFYTEPVRPDGTVDFVAAINARSGRGVTPENNAVIALLQAAGPEMIYKPIRGKIYRLLGMEPLPEEGAYFRMLTMDKPARDEAEQAKEGPWKAGDLPLAAKWLKDNEAALAKVGRAVRRSRYFYPLAGERDSSLFTDASIPMIGPTLFMGQALIARAMARLQEGDMPGMWADVRAARKLARLVGQGPTLVDRLVAIAVEMLSCEAIIAIAQHGNLTAADAKAALAEAAAWPPMPDVAEAVDTLERIYGVESVILLAIADQEGGFGGVLPLFLLECRPIALDARSPTRPAYAPVPDDLAKAHVPVNWDLALRTMNEDYDRIVAAMRQKTFAMRQSQIKAVTEQLQKAAEQNKDTYEPPDGANSFLREYIAATPQRRDELIRSLVHMWTASTAPAVTYPSQIQDTRAVWRTLSEAALALAACKAETGKYPARLTDLTPKYVKAVPQDLFADGPLAYKPAGGGYVLYSVGPNMTDDGGSKEGEADDIVVRVGGE